MGGDTRTLGRRPMCAAKFYGRVNLGGVYGRWTSSSVDLGQSVWEVSKFYNGNALLVVHNACAVSKF